MMEEIWKSGNFGFHDERYQKESSGKREGTKRRLWSSFIKYVPYAPMEALSFPWFILFRVSKKNRIY